MLTGEIAKQYLKRFGNAPTLQIAKKLCDEHPLIFSSTEQARMVVRYYRGSIGNKNRKYLKDEEYVRSIEDSLQKKGG